MAPTRDHKKLAAELTRLRRLSDLDVPGFVKAIQKTAKMSRPTMYRICAAEAIPSMPVVKAWLRVTKADSDTRESVLDLADRVRSQTVKWSGMLTGIAQAQVAERERESVRIRVCQRDIIPGLLQTEPYMRAMLPALQVAGLNIEATITGRLKRQELLAGAGRTLQFLMFEHLLHDTRFGDVIPEQLDDMMRLAELPWVELGIVPADTDVSPMWHSFTIHDLNDGSACVILELVHGEERVGDPADVQAYVELWERLWAAAATGDDAVTLIRKAD